MKGLRTGGRPGGITSPRSPQSFSGLHPALHPVLHIPPSSPFKVWRDRASDRAPLHAPSGAPRSRRRLLGAAAGTALPPTRSRPAPRGRYTRQVFTASASAASGSPVGMNSCATYPANPVCAIARITAG